MKVLLFVGAGTSIELGVPGMAGMAREFLEHAKQWKVEPELVEKIMGNSLDVEHFIEELDRICGARASLEALGQDRMLCERFDNVRAEVEWFVQHAAERVVARDAQLMWGSVLRATASVVLTVVTTNYDRAIELAANAEQIYLNDGFGQFDRGETAPWVGFAQEALNALLVKLHGSTDWYAAESGSPTKLRHPMPLFGRSSLRLADGTQLGSALVLPSREKLLTRAPYPRLSQTFLNASDDCDLAVFIGSSLRDHHIRGAAQAIALRVPVFVINPDGNSHGIGGAMPIVEHASTFLVSTLPNALMTPDPAGALALHASTRREVNRTGILSAVRQALDGAAEPRLRCQAIEELDDRGAGLDPFLLRQLFADNDETVARYALGLIPLSPTRETLIEAAANAAHADHPAYREDMQLLRSLVSEQSIGPAAFDLGGSADGKL